MLAALVASLRRELAEAAGALAQARTELARARERIAELEARLRQNPLDSSKPPHRWVRRDRVPGGRPAGLGALRPHRQVLPVATV